MMKSIVNVTFKHLPKLKVTGYVEDVRCGMSWLLRTFIITKWIFLSFNSSLWNPLSYSKRINFKRKNTLKKFNFFPTLKSLFSLKKFFTTSGQQLPVNNFRSINSTSGILELVYLSQNKTVIVMRMYVDINCTYLFDTGALRITVSSQKKKSFMFSSIS